MPSDRIYILSHADYDCYRWALFSGPEVEDWGALCRSLLDEAAQIAVRRNDDYWVGWDTLQKVVAEQLEAIGYRRLDPPEECWSGTSIIEDESDGRGRLCPETFRLIAAHNAAQRAETESRRAAYFEEPRDV